MRTLREPLIGALALSAFLLPFHPARSAEYSGSFVDWSQPGVRTAAAFVAATDLITDVDLKVNNAQTFLGFSYNAMMLISPSGTAAYLFDTSTYHITGKSLFLTYFDDSASTVISGGIPPYIGPYRPAQSFSRFNGEWSVGTWTLAVYNDALGGNTGSVSSWALVLNPPTPTPTSTPDPAVPTPTPMPVPICPVYAGPYFEIPGQQVASGNIQINSTRKVEKVTVNIEDFHLVSGSGNDLDNIGMYLVSPQDTVVALFEKHQLAESLLFGTWFESSDAYPLISTGIGPYIGRYRPTGNLTTLNGEPVQGDWKLVVFNDYPPQPDLSDYAYVEEWNLVICETDATPTPSPSPLTTPSPTPFGFETPSPTPTPLTICRTFNGSGFSWTGVDVVSATIQVPAGMVTDVDVTVGEAYCNADLSGIALYILSPDYTHVALFKKQQLSGHQLYQTTFNSDPALNPITSGQAPYIGSYRPVESLAGFSGQSAGGTWTLLLYNESAANPGSVTGWNLRICAENAAPTPTPSPTLPPTPSPTPSIIPPIPTPMSACPAYIGFPFTAPGTTVAESGVNVMTPGFVGDVDVLLSFHMLDKGDLDLVSMYLRSGQGTVVQLFPKHVLSEHALYQTYFDDSAWLCVTEGTGAYVGPFRPTGNLSDFNNETITGTWSLIVFNDYSCSGVGCLDSGVVDNWRLYVCPAPSRTPTPIPTCTPLTTPTPTPFDYLTPIPETPTPTPPCVDYAGSSLSWTGVGVATSTVTVNDVGVVVGLRVQISEASCVTSWDSVGMYLMSPGGTDVALFEKHQLLEHQLYLTTFDDSAWSAVTSGVAPYIGSYRPVEKLSTLNGEGIAGTWTLVVYNDSSGNDGTVSGWSLYLCAFPPPTPTPTAVIVPPTPTPLAGALPLLAAGDYNGDGTSDVGVYRPSLGFWTIRNIGTDFLAGEPTSGDYDGDGTAEIAVFRSATGEWIVNNVTRFYFGSSSGIPVPGDYNGDGICDAAMFRRSSGLWAVRNFTRLYFGGSADLPIPGDYDDDGTTDFAVFRPASSLWAIRNISRYYFGGANDFIIPRDYAGTGSLSAIFRPSISLWAIMNHSRFYYGAGGDLPVPADYNGDGLDEVAVFRPSNGLWAIQNFSRIYWGGSGDIPVAR